MLFEHDDAKEPVGMVLDAHVHKDRLWVAVMPKNSQNGNLARLFMGEGGEANELPQEVRFGELSMGMEWEEAPDGNRVDKKVPESGQVHEVSLVHKGAYEGTKIHGSLPYQDFRDRGGLAGIINTVAAAASAKTFWVMTYKSLLEDRQAPRSEQTA